MSNIIITNPVASIPLQMRPAGDAGAAHPGPGVSDPAVREALGNLRKTFARFDAGLDQLERIARRSAGVVPS